MYLKSRTIHLNMPTRRNFFLLVVVIGFTSILNISCNPDEDASRFEKISSTSSGVNFSNNLIEDNKLNYFTYPYLYMGGGVATGDINNDGLVDIFFTGNMVSNKLYLNRGEFQFEDISLKAGIKGDDRWYSGVTMVDINADGFLDIYISVSGKDKTTQNELYINNGDLSFSEKAEQYGIADQGKSVQSTFFDYDRDGDLDLYVANYPITSFATPNEMYRKLMDEVSIENSDHLFRNDGNGSFTNVTEAAGLLSFGLSLSATVGDLNGDGWEDLYVSNDFATPDYMFINNGDGTFTESLQTATKQTSFYGMGADIADYNNDGLLDIMQVDMAAEDNRRAKANMASMNPDLFWSTVDFGMHYQYMYNALQLNRGNKDNSPVFSNVTWAAGVATTDWSWGPLFADFDNDGWKDLFVSNGTRRDINNRDFFLGLKKDLSKASDEELKLEVQNIPSEPIANYIFKNNKDLSFKKANDDWGIDMIGFSNGVSYADLNNNGQLDLIVNNIDEPAYIYRNALSTDNNFIDVSLFQAGANRNAIGAKVEIITEQVNHQLQHLTLSRGFQSSVSPMLHFGIGSINKIDTIIITWPDGSQEFSTNLEINNKIKITKGELQAYNPIEQQPAKLFTNYTEPTSLPAHVENEFDDYKFQVLLPHKMSQWGPALAVADINNDKREDLFLGAASRSTAGIYTQNEDGSFQLYQDFPEANILEDIDALSIDIDNDNDLDLFVVSGGYELPYNDKFYFDRLYLNEKGNYEYFGDLPKILSSGSCIRPYDYDQDGDLDLFVGGRMRPLQYPNAGRSYLLRNNLKDGRLSFEDVTKEVMPEVADVGMVTDARWIDYNDDGQTDLVTVGEWMPITVFLNKDEKFTNETSSLDLEDTRGWWFSLEASDLDKDGDLDLILGNLGNNYKYIAKPDASFDLYVDDFDKNSSTDIVLSYYNDEKQYPVRGRQCSAEQIPGIKSKFKNYESFAIATTAEIYGEKQLESAQHFQIKDFSSIILENQGGGDYKKHKLPMSCQLSTINDILIDDFNADGNQDILIAGNLYGSEVETPRADASIGQVLLGMGQLKFKELSYNESGLLLNADVKKLAKLKGPKKEYLLAACNNGPLILHNIEHTTNNGQND